jgi:hypothetical protein
MLREFERAVGFAEGVVMSFDPDVLLPNGSGGTATSCGPRLSTPPGNAGAR